MPEEPGRRPLPAAPLPDDPEEIAALLPFRLLRSQLLPPAPNRRKSAADWIADFAGASWLGYGASSLLVISHFPDPLYKHETLVGSFFQQVIELPPPRDAGDRSGDVNAVRWCPERPSSGQIAAAGGNCVWLYSPESAGDPSSFCWRQTAGIVQSFLVEAIEWTSSGDGLVVAGIAVALWTRKSIYWEMAWKCSSEVPQSMVSATQFSQGPVATAACLSSCVKGSYTEESSTLSSKEVFSVSVFVRDGKSGIVKLQLFHPQTVTMIQWRPSTVSWSAKNTSHSWRDVLLTCCLDGTVRLWSEIDSSRVKKFRKDKQEQKSVKKAFHVIAAIEINQCLRGTLGTDIFISWAIETSGVICKAEGDSYSLKSEVSKHDPVGKCEWLISVGPWSSLSFWAIHCLDDTSPLRFPRVILWKTQDLMECKECNFWNNQNSFIQDKPVFIQAVVSRDLLSGPPVHCSLLLLGPDNFFSWLQFYNPMSNNKTNEPSSHISKEENLSCFAGGVLNHDGHTGKIIQLDVHPFSCEIEFAVTLDSDGVLLFWSLSSILGCTLGAQGVIHPTWKLLGKVVLRGTPTDSRYSVLRWAPPIVDDNLFLLLGNSTGIDCYSIQVTKMDGDVLCHKMLTIPFDGFDHEGSPDHIFTLPIATTSEQSFFSNCFLLSGLWMKNFQATAWKVFLHTEDPSGNNLEHNSDFESNTIVKRETINFVGRRFYATADLCMSSSPDPQSCEHVTSIAVLSTDNHVLSIQNNAASYTSARNTYMYTMATGFTDGTLKLWRISNGGGAAYSDPQFLQWEVVGMLRAHQGPISAVSLSSPGGKVATVSMDGQRNITSLHIWEPMCLIGGGNFLLEDVISLSGAVVTLNWRTIGNGRLLLGVCMTNEFRVYTEKKITDQKMVKLVKSKHTNIWVCIAVSHVQSVCRDFHWGPSLIAVLVHEKHLSIFSQWSSRAETELSKDQKDRDLPHAIYTERGMGDAEESSLNKSNHENNHFQDLNLEILRKPYQFDTSRFHSILDMSNKLHGCLAVYHPKALLHYLFSGNWKHALAVVRHLVEAIESDSYATISESTNSEYSPPKILSLHFSAYFEQTISANLSNKSLEWGKDIPPRTSSVEFQRNLFQFEERDLFTNAPKSMSISIPQNSEITGFVNTLEMTKDISGITGNMKAQILAIVDLLSEISDTGSVYGSLDESGRRFWVGVRYEHLHFLRIYGRLAAAKEIVVNSELVSWAFHSDCKENLFDSVLSVEASWSEMRNMGVGFWFTNTAQLRTKMEKLARSQYLKRKDPKDCALLYLALNRIQVLAGLFKISRDEKDKLLVAFLSRNFQEDKNKAAALKNAYVLMGRHQLELAIAFFLLGGDPSSAVTVCAKNLGDEQLALIICRVIEGYGGPLEHQLISNFLLPTAIEKGDYWLSSLLEWMLGNYSQSLKRLIDSPIEFSDKTVRTLANQAAFADPTVGQYCAILASKNSLKNSVGDHLAVMLSKLALSMTAIALRRQGLPLEALECLTSFRMEGKHRINLSDIESCDIFRGILYPFSCDGACNWMLGDVACNLESNATYDLSLQYISKLLSDHLNCPFSNLASSRKLIIHEYGLHNSELLIRYLKEKVNVVMTVFEHSYSLNPVDLCNKILVLVGNMGLLYLGYSLLERYFIGGHGTGCCNLNGLTLHSNLSRLLQKSSKEISHLLAKYVVYCNLVDLTPNPSYCSSSGSRKDQYGQFRQNFCLQNILFLLTASRPVLKLYYGCVLADDLNLKTFAALDFLEYCVHIAHNWVRKNTEGLILMIQPMLNASVADLSSFEVITKLVELLHQNTELMFHDISSDVISSTSESKCEARDLNQVDSPISSISEDERWLLLGACLWLHISTFAKHHLKDLTVSERHDNENVDLLNLFPFLIVDLVITSLEYISTGLSKQLRSFLRQKVLKGSPVSLLHWMNETVCSQTRSLHHNSNQRVDMLQQTTNNETQCIFNKLCEFFICHKDIIANLLDDKHNCFCCTSVKYSTLWQDIWGGMLAENGNVIHENHKTEKSDDGLLSQSKISKGAGFHDTNQQDSSLNAPTLSFDSPKEVFKRNGELFESICINLIDEQQVALASNRKGLLFFNWKTNKSIQVHSDYIWSESDWPKNGWAGCESTPIPTFVSPGIGLGGKRGGHLGLGGATIGLGSLARPGRDLTGGGAFGIPGYAGIGASGLGWGEQENFADYVDPPATVENIRSRAICSHPSKPFLLVGSSNTHVYLWEFGKDRALATYGILPAANVPPPYALASISALRFDHCGHRFATAALDGTICTWQLEVGGRSNVQPTESSLCFNYYASDVAYVGESGSILAAAGCSSNGLNVVVWDTLAPPATSKVSLICHEGGARSLSIFDNDVGSGSISPLIVTGGKGGDVGVHDFRYIVTGKSKRHQQSSDQGMKSPPMQNPNSGIVKHGETSNGMLWHIPKAHLGSVTKISTIPNTSLFLTGSKDGDVKLWDAKKSQLVFHWPKLHDKHTFLQPTSRGFGGVVRVAVTDIQVLPHGFLTCGGDGLVKLVQLRRTLQHELILATASDGDDGQYF